MIHFDHLATLRRQPKSRLRGAFSAIGFRQIAGTSAKIRICHLGIRKPAPCLRATQTAKTWLLKLGS